MRTAHVLVCVRVCRPRHGQTLYNRYFRDERNEMRNSPFYLFVNPTNYSHTAARISADSIHTHTVSFMPVSSLDKHVTLERAPYISIKNQNSFFFLRSFFFCLDEHASILVGVLSNSAPTKTVFARIHTQSPVF